jgi:hypothetical protein
MTVIPDMDAAIDQSTPDRRGEVELVGLVELAIFAISSGNGLGQGGDVYTLPLKSARDVFVYRAEVGMFTWQSSSSAQLQSHMTRDERKLWHAFCTLSTAMGQIDTDLICYSRFAAG